MKIAMNACYSYSKISLTINRVLQRTNLDVNLAVNNLLSRDDEEGDDAEDAADTYVPEDRSHIFARRWL